MEIYLVIEARGGWGNKAISWAAAFLWATATNRTLLIRGIMFGFFFEDPFESMPWQHYQVDGYYLGSLSQFYIRDTVR